jgi:hypothetical protein
MKPATFDVLDSYLYSKESKKNRLEFDVRFDHNSKSFLLDSESWKSYHKKLKKIKFNWKEIKYKDIVEKQIDLTDLIKSKKIGIYMFVVRSEHLINDLPKFVIYIGISGTTDSKRPLRDRLKDYFYISKIKKREAVHSLLIKWYSNTYINYALLDCNKEEIEEIETNLIGFFAPIANKDDLPGDLGKKKKGF